MIIGVCRNRAGSKSRFLRGGTCPIFQLQSAAWHLGGVGAVADKTDGRRPAETGLPARVV